MPEQASDHLQQQRQFSLVQILAGNLGQQHAAAVMTKEGRDLSAGEAGEDSSFMGENMRDNLQPYGLAFDWQPPEAGEIPCAYLCRRRDRPKPALGEARMRPCKVGGGPDGRAKA